MKMTMVTSCDKGNVGHWTHRPTKTLANLDRYHQKARRPHPMTRVILDIRHITQQGVLLKIKAAEGRLQKDRGHIRGQK